VFTDYTQKVGYYSQLQYQKKYPKGNIYYDSSF